jgi:protein-tyrosine phosphatase
MSDCVFADLHSHFLFGVDDGARDLKASLRLIEQAQENNIKYMLATPHVSEVMNDEFSNLIITNFARLQEEAAKRNYSVEIFLASEILFNEDIFKWLDAPWSTINNNKKYLLFELPFFTLPQRVDEFIFHCKMKNITPVLAHPERYFYMHNKLDMLLKWHSEGCLMQMDAGSIVGQFGKKVLNVSKKMAQMEFFSVVASDAHNVIGRNYVTMYDAFDIMRELTDIDYVNMLFCNNPLNIIKGNKVNPFPVKEETVNFSIKGVVDKLFGKNKW